MSGVSIARIRGENRFYNPPAVRQRQHQQQSVDSDDCATSYSSGSGREVVSDATNLYRFLEYTTPVVVAQYFPKTGVKGWRTRESELHPYFVLGDLWESFKEWSAYGAGVPLLLNGSDSVIQYYVPYLSAIQLYVDPSKPSTRTSTGAKELPIFIICEINCAEPPCTLIASFKCIFPSVKHKINFSYVHSDEINLLAGKCSCHIIFHMCACCYRRPGDESDAESSRETSSNGSSDYGTERGFNNVPYSALSWQNAADVNGHGWNKTFPRNKPLNGSSSDESGEACNPGQLIFQYMEHDQPFGREPLADKAILASQFPELRTYRSCDLSHSSWLSVAWYPIYRIPTGPTLQSLDACFLTFHSLSTPTKGASADGLQCGGARDRDNQNADFKLSLPIFGLASYKFKVSFWNPNGVYECQKADSLLQAADNWLRLLQVNHPDFNFFVSHSIPKSKLAVRYDEQGGCVLALMLTLLMANEL
ncbi:unnamed protein product [Malus baccata var. baccata]